MSELKVNLIPELDRQPADKWDIRFLELALLVRNWSKDPSTKHATVIVRPDKTIASVGYNGFVRGCPVDESAFSDPAKRPEKYSRVVHGEMNAILNAHEPIRGCTAYVTSGVGCDRCTVHLLQAGIKRFVFLNGDADYWSRWGKEAERSLGYIKEMKIPASIVSMPAGLVAWEFKP